MKVVASLADSASVKEFEFSKSIDTTRQQPETPVVNELISGPSTGVKKRSGVTHFIPYKDGRTLISRKSGEIAIDHDVIGHVKDTVVGLALTPKENVVVFTSSGECVLISETKTSQFQLRNALTSVVQNPNNLLQFASAGEEQLPDVFNLKINEKSLETEVEVVWKATQPPNDILDLPELNLVSGLAFVEPQNLVSVTSKGKIRVYYLTEQSGQPEHMIQASKDGIKSVTADPSHPNTVIIGDSRSTVSRWSLDPPKLLGHYKGVCGSTRSISVRGPYLATGGLDRYIRVFDVVKRQPAGKLYVGNEVWALALLRTDDEEDLNELDAFWDEIDSNPKRRKVENGKEKQKEKEEDEHSSGESDEEEEFSDEGSSGEDESNEESDGSFGGFDD